MDVIILAGGLGTRLRSVVSELPKCMAPVCGKPFLFYLLKYLTNYKIDKVILSVGYLRERVEEWIEQESSIFPFSFEYAIEDEPLGTGGGIKLALKKTTSSEVCVLNGDTFFSVDLDALLSQHKQTKSDLSIALKLMLDFERYGNVEVDAYNHVTTFKEKAYCAKGQINGGIYIINRENEFMKKLPRKFSFETEVLQPQVELGTVCGFVHNGYFIDIGIPEDYAKANSDFLALFK